ncbi:MAG: hypothetical protein LBT92_03000, partial [Rickettsiales bacterium]|nr:hypothetical protein [Rickettsiales bacterium]
MMNKVINIDYSKLSGDAAEMIREVSPETAKAAFGKNVQNVEIAWSSLCNHAGAGNKKCGSFCINCGADYATSAYGQFLFDRGLWERVASDIASTGYKGRFQCNRYNEPFAVGVDDLKFYIGTLRKYNPDCQIIFNTNGDFLTREKLDAARDAGLSSLNIQIYPSLGSGEAHSTETSRKYLEKYEEKFGLKAEPVMECSGIYDEYKLVYDGVDALVYAKNIPMLGCNRGEAVAVGRPAERR